MASASGCAAVVGRAIESLGGLDILVNNAGIYPIRSIEESDEALWDQTMDINVKSMFFCSQAALPALRGANGVIINHASNGGLLGFSGIVLYCASKGAVVNLTRALAMELAPEIRVNCVCPATIDTEMGRQEFELSADPRAALAAYEAACPMKRIGTVDDVAASIVFLASDEASYLTGVVLPIDGGKSAGRQSPVVNR